MAPEQVARHQKARLEGAMVEAVARHGYAGTTLRELVTLAGVSKSTFYDHFESKQECFLATFDEIVDQLSVRVAEAYRSGGDFRERLSAALGVFMNMAVEEPAAASLAAVESLTLGAAGVDHRERASATFEALIQQSFDHSSSRQVSETTVRAIVAGIRGVTYRRLRGGRREELPGLVDGLVDWALAYQEPDSEMTRRAVAASERNPVEVLPEARPGDDQLPGWDEPPDSPTSRMALTQRERIVRAAATVGVERGYVALSIPAISGAAGVSNQTFYEHFDSKRAAFLAAFEILAGDAVAVAVAAFEREDEYPEAIGATFRASFEHIAATELFARLAFFELPTAGPAALDQADAILDSFGALLEPSAAGEDRGETLPKSIKEAILSGTWATIQREMAHGRLQSLPQLAPEMVRIAVAPLSRR